MATTLELTDREIAIARGDEPTPEGSVTGSADKREAAEPVDDSTSPGEPESPEAEIEPEGPDDLSPEQPRESVEEAAAKLREQKEDSDEPAEEEASSDPEWLTDDVRDIAESYGMTDDDLSEFSNLDEFRRAGRLIDKQFATQTADKPTDTQPEQPGSGDEKKIAQSDATPADPVDEKTLAEDEQALIDRFKEDYPEEVQELVKQHVQANRQVNDLKSKIDSIQQWQQNLFQEQQMREFDSIVDTIDSKLFGRTEKDGEYVELSKAHFDQRSRLFEAAQTIQAGIERRAKQMGREPEIPSLRALVQRAYQYEFGDTGSKRVSAAKKQASRKRPVGTKGNRTRVNYNPNSNDPDDIANAPEIRSFWAKAQEEQDG